MLLTHSHVKNAIVQSGNSPYLIGRIIDGSIDLSIGLYIQNVSSSKVGWSGVLLQEKANGKRYFLKYKDGTSSKDYGHRSPTTENLECFTRYRCFWSRICSGNQVEVTATEGSQDCAPHTTAGGLCPGTMWSPNGSEPTSVTCIETPDDPTPPTPPTDPTNPPTPPPGGTNPDPFVNVELPSAAPAAEADVLNIPCSASYNFIRQGNWQSAVIVDYKFGLYNRAGNGQYYL
ncbi:MAG TPA: hypothetical protein VFS25_02450 [Chitinophaga sp.]|uniref:hypothetical protein n=1 Tax=Chitinophaga sp. TaxID=1869181 RepID=UPI002DBD49FF|nr:hypothetical protein [Chitinophaga sp.]HEU4551658.1 hypothetical protein [Chitinophaga sp.]